MAIESRENIIARYKALREINVRHQAAAIDKVSTAALVAHAKRLGLAVHNQIAADDTELTYIFDLGLYTATPGRSRAIDRHARALKVKPGSDDWTVLEAMRNARFSLWRVERKHGVAGLVVRDLVREEEVWLMDLAFETSAPLGLTIGSRLFTVEGFAMTCGVSVAVDAEMVDAIFDVCGFLLDRPDAAVADDRRFATALYRLSVEGLGPIGLEAWAA